LTVIAKFRAERRVPEKPKALPGQHKTMSHL
jgi:hypothetical protein